MDVQLVRTIHDQWVNLTVGPMRAEEVRRS
jgi:hypothetical protein